MDIRTVEKYIGLEDDSEEIEDKDTRFKKHDAIVSKKEGNIARVKELHKQYYSNSAIARDIEAVKNAIICDYSNGLAQSSVNKLKVIKRIMYGRNNFDMLHKKVLLLENRRKIN